MADYSEKLKDPRWQKKRLEVLERDNWACVECGASNKTLNVHHLEYNGRNPWETDTDRLRTLCEDCHTAAHKMRQLANGCFARLSIAGARDLLCGLDAAIDVCETNGWKLATMNVVRVMFFDAVRRTSIYCNKEGDPIEDAMSLIMEPEGD